MKRLNKNELANINGGALSATLINSITQGIGIFLDLGRTVGSGIRRIISGKVCSC